MNSKNHLISFVLPIYNEGETLNTLWAELQSLKSEINKNFSDKLFNFEFIFVSDGSKDNSNEILEKIYLSQPEEVKVRIFGRNFGHQIAVTAGQDIAQGDAVIIMDSDLQDPPLVCIELIRKWLEGFDIVFAQRKTYKINFTKKLPAFLFYRLMSRIANIDIPKDTGDFRLISKAVNDEMKKFPEKNRFLRGISFLTGFKQTGVLFDRAPRYAGKPVYTFSKSLKLAFDGITSFSLFPIRLVTFVGFSFSLLAILFGIIYVLFSLVVSKTAIEGWASLMITVVFIGGVQLMMLGILGEYIGRIYTQVINRPLYTVVKDLKNLSK
jgi:polyisoprenyl-phosphate glycosyltransferase